MAYFVHFLPILSTFGRPEGQEWTKIAPNWTKIAQKHCFFRPFLNILGIFPTWTPNCTFSEILSDFDPLKASQTPLWTVKSGLLPIPAKQRLGLWFAWKRRPSGWPLVSTLRCSSTGVSLRFTWLRASSFGGSPREVDGIRGPGWPSF